MGLYVNNNDGTMFIFKPHNKNREYLIIRKDTGPVVEGYCFDAYFVSDNCTLVDYNTFGLTESEVNEVLDGLRRRNGTSYSAAAYAYSRKMNRVYPRPQVSLVNQETPTVNEFLLIAALMNEE